MGDSVDRQEKPRILVVDDEEAIRHILVNVLEESGCEARAADTAEGGLALLPDFDPAVVFLDIFLPGKSGLDMLADIKKTSPDTEVVMITSHASADTALRAIKQGAYTYLEKPFEDLDQILITVQRALGVRSLALKNRDLQQKQEERSRRLSSDVPLQPAPSANEALRSCSELVEFFMDMIARELDVERACLMLIDEPTGSLRIASSRGLGTLDPQAVSVKLGEGISGRVAADGERYFAPAAGKKRRSPERAPLHPSETFFTSPIALCVAIKRPDGRILGVICLGDRNSGKAFGDGDATHLAMLGDRLAAAIHEARRADQLERAYESLKAAQEQLVVSERVKAIGQMAAGVAHDFNNALSVILARAEFIQSSLAKDVPDRGKMRSDMETIIKTALQGAETIKRIQDYTRTRKDVPRTPVDVNTAVRDAVEITRPKWKQAAEAQAKRIEIHTDLGEVPNVSGNIYELTQVVENLIFNAVEAMPRGGRISLTTRRNGTSVIVTIADTGTGMDEATKKRLFEPFFTTKEYGQGLGTSIIYGIVRRHRGDIVVRSAPGQGATFEITLPTHVPGSARDERPTEAPAGPGRPARVLLVDDEDPVREVYREALEAAGHEVVAAPGGREALAAFEKGKFDLVITDLSMEGMSGFEVAREIKKIDPSITVILLSGWAKGEQEEPTRKAGFDSVLIKPCRLEDLRRAVKDAVRFPLKG